MSTGDAYLSLDGSDWAHAGSFDDPLGFDDCDGPVQFMGLGPILRPVDIQWDPVALALAILAPHLANDPRYQPGRPRR